VLLGLPFVLQLVCPHVAIDSYKRTVPLEEGWFTMVDT